MTSYTNIPLQDLSKDAEFHDYTVPTQHLQPQHSTSSIKSWLLRDENNLIDKWFVLPCAIVLSLLSGICVPVVCWLFGNVFNYFVRFKQQLIGPWQLQNWNNVYVIGMVITACVCFVSTFVALVLWKRLAVSSSHAYRVESAKSVVNHGETWSQAMFQFMPSGGSLNPVDMIDKSADVVHHSIAIDAHNFLTQMATFVAGFILALVLSWRLGLILLAILPLMAALVYFIGRWSGKFAKRSLQAQNKAANLAQQTLSNAAGSTGLHSWGKSTLDFVRAQFTSFLSGAQGAGERAAHAHAFGLATAGFVVFAVASLGFYYAGQLVSWALNSPGDVLAVFWSMFLGCSALAATPKALASIRDARAYIGFEQHMTRLVPISHDAIAPSVSMPHLSQVSSNMSMGRTGVVGKSVRFDNVSDRSCRLAVFSCTFSTNSVTAVVSSNSLTGTPHSSVQLGPLIQRQCDPTNGSVYLDETDLHLVAPGVLTSQNVVGVVDSDPHMIPGASLMENLVMGNSQNADKAREVCKVVGLDARINALPQGYDSAFLDNGSRSLMDRADMIRLAVARALLTDPDVLVLDQGCTSALSPKEERALIEAILPVHAPRAGRTVIIVNPHRETLTSQGITNVVVLAPSGTVLASGSRQEILGQEPWSNLTAPKEIKGSYEPIGPDGFSVLAPTVMPSDAKALLDNFDPTLPRYTLADVFKLNKPEHPLLFIGTIAAIIRGLIIPAFCASLAQLLATLSNIRPADVSSGSSFWAIVLVMLGCLEGFVFYVDVFCFELAAERLTMRIRKNAFDAVTQKPYTWFQDPNHSPNRIMNVLAVDAPRVRGATTSTWANLIHWIAVTLGGLIWALVVGWQLALVGMAAAIPLMLLGIWLERKWYSQAHVKDVQSYSNANQALGEVLADGRVVGKEEYVDSFTGKLSNKGPSSPSSYFLARLVLAFCACLPFLVQALMWWYGATLVATLQYSLVQFLTVWLITTFVALTIGQVSHIKDVFDGSLISLRRVADLLAPASATSALVTQQATQALQNSKEACSLTLQNLLYAYPSKALVPAIDGISIHIPAGSRTLIVGGHNTGKTTLLSLIVNNLAPNSGSVLVDGVDVRQVDAEVLHSRVALIGKDGVLLDNFTVEENVAFGSTSLTAADVAEACRQAGLPPFDFKMMVGSPQFQNFANTPLTTERVLLARALIRKPGLLLFDDVNPVLASCLFNIPRTITIVWAASDWTLYEEPSMAWDGLLTLDNGRIRV